MKALEVHAMAEKVRKCFEHFVTDEVVDNDYPDTLSRVEVKSDADMFHSRELKKLVEIADDYPFYVSVMGKNELYFVIC